MILADTSIWVDHLRSGDSELANELNRGTVLMHPFIAGELALGSMTQRKKILAEIDSLPVAGVARVEEVRHLIEQRVLFSCGIGYIDVHLIASVSLTPHTLLWTRDKRLRAVVESLGLHASLS
jgi:predicted nucleic acid-binding protein